MADDDSGAHGCKEMLLADFPAVGRRGCAAKHSLSPACFKVLDQEGKWTSSPLTLFHHDGDKASS